MSKWIKESYSELSAIKILTDVNETEKKIKTKKYIKQKNNKKKHIKGSRYKGWILRPRSTTYFDGRKRKAVSVIIICCLVNHCQFSPVVIISGHVKISVRSADNPVALLIWCEV